MTAYSEVQQEQESQYGFPYHHIPEFRNGFSTAVFSAFGINYVSTIEFLLSKLGELDFQSICDVGSGDGRLVKEMASEFPGRRVCGIDYSQRAVDLARGFNPGLSFIRTDIVRDAPLEKFDAITLIEVFEHIPIEEADGFVKALHGLLNARGTLLLTVPHSNKKVSAKHYQHFDSGSLRNYFEPYFQVEEESFFEKKRCWRNYFIRRILKNKLFILNNKKLLDLIYREYKKHCFLSDEQHCGRIFLKLVKI